MLRFHRESDCPHPDETSCRPNGLARDRCASGASGQLTSYWRPTLRNSGWAVVSRFLNFGGGRSFAMNPSTSSSNKPSCALPLGFAFMYLAWGGTYLGAKFAIVDLPVLMMSGTRFFCAGVLLLSGLAVFDRAGFRRGTLREWKDAAMIGFLLLVLGIGTGNWIQQYVDSSFIAMVFSALPLWIVIIDWLRPGGRAPTRTVAIGLLLGFVGVGLILVPTASGGHRSSSLAIDLLLVLASICWAGGAVFSRHVYARGNPLLSVARQMIVAGTILLLASIVHGDPGSLHLSTTRPTAWIGFAYLLLIGSLSGYPVYIWLMRTCPPAKVATIPYVNLLVAVFLGWSLGHETITSRLLLGAVIVLASVAVVLRTDRPDAIAPGD
jgi:drug/metabolite transporter (DMT)-like permease